MGFPYKTPAQVPHFKTRPGYKLAKTWLPAVPVLQHYCQLPPQAVPFTLVININLSFVGFKTYFYVNYNGA